MCTCNFFLHHEWSLFKTDPKSDLTFLPTPSLTWVSSPELYSPHLLRAPWLAAASQHAESGPGVHPTQRAQPCLRPCPQHTVAMQACHLPSHTPSSLLLLVRVPLAYKPPTSGLTASAQEGRGTGWAPRLLLTEQVEVRVCGRPVNSNQRSSRTPDCSPTFGCESSPCSGPGLGPQQSWRAKSS